MRKYLHDLSNKVALFDLKIHKMKRITQDQDLLKEIEKLEETSQDSINLIREIKLLFKDNLDKITP